jgi:hypothetical protein
VSLLRKKEMEKEMYVDVNIVREMERQQERKRKKTKTVVWEMYSFHSESLEDILGSLLLCSTF